jgi:hypothetical protein
MHARGDTRLYILRDRLQRLREPVFSEFPPAWRNWQTRWTQNSEISDFI